MTEENTYIRKDQKSSECRMCRRHKSASPFRLPVEDPSLPEPHSSYHPAPHEPFMKTGEGVY